MKVVTDTLNGLNIGNSMERLDKRISTLTDKVIELETHLATKMMCQKTWCMMPMVT
jgi:hypothetical protein